MSVSACCVVSGEMDVGLENVEKGDAPFNTDSVKISKLFYVISIKIYDLFCFILIR